LKVYVILKHEDGGPLCADTSVAAVFYDEDAADDFVEAARTVDPFIGYTVDEHTIQ